MAVSPKSRLGSALLLFFLVLPLTVLNAAAPTATAPAPDGDDPAQEQWVWCVDSQESLSLCNQMQTLLEKIDTVKEHTHTCILGDEDVCMKKIRDGDARFGIFDGGEIWEAAQTYGLVPIRTEYDSLEKSPGRYYGVGIVNANNCPKKLSDMKGWKSCHTGYGRASGWVLPVTYLIQNKIMPIVSKEGSTQSPDIQSVESFFSKSCAANDDPKKEICTACKQTTGCDKSDLYYDYPGSFRCLVEGSGDVAFTKGIIPGLYAKGGDLEQQDWKGLKDAEQYKILCPGLSNGELCTSVANYKTCNFGTAPGHSVMVSKSFSQKEVEEFHTVMDAANNDPQYITLFSGANTTINEFAAGVAHSIRYNKTAKELLGSLYNNIIYLQVVNAAQKTTSSAASRLSPPRALLSTSPPLIPTLALSLSLLLLLHCAAPPPPPHFPFP